MGRRGTLDDTSRKALGVIRIVNGGLGLLLPRVLIRRIDPEEPPSPAAIYAFRLFGVRTVLIGHDLLFREGEALDRSLDEAVAVHASDSITAATLAVTGAVPRRTGLMLTVISVVNTVLALVARRTRHG